jgi:methanogenic corrinoid protein MtbC1
MSEPTQFVASLIEAGAAGYAAAAAERIVERHPETAERFGAGAFRAWQEHLGQRLRELAAALVAGDPGLFNAEVAWSRVAFEGRDVPTEDLRASLECLKEVLAEELPAAAGAEPGRYLEQGLETLDAELTRPALADAADSPIGRLALAYLEATLSGDRRRAVETVLSAVDGGLEVAAAYEALMAAQREVGEMWHAGDLAVAQEHFTTATTQSLLTLLAERARSTDGGPNGKTVMVAVAPGDAHYIGARVLANLFEHQGWRTIHLAGGLPPVELALGVEAFEVDLLVLSLTVSTRLPATIEAVQQVRRRRPGCKVLVGGRVPARSPVVGERIGADACAATAEEALRLGARLVGLD